MSYTDKNTGKTFKTVRNEAFGASKLKYFTVGDLVSWSSLEFDDFGEPIRLESGLLKEIRLIKRDNYSSYEAVILDFMTQKEVIVSLIILKKSNFGD